MDTTALLVKLLPASVLPYLKFVVTVLGGGASAVLNTYPNVDHRLTLVSLAITAAATYFTPNVQPVKLVGNVAKQEVDQSEWITYSDCPCDTPNKEAEKPEPAPVTVQAQAPAQAPLLPTPPAPPVKEVGV